MRCAPISRVSARKLRRFLSLRYLSAACCHACTNRFRLSSASISSTGRVSKNTVASFSRKFPASFNKRQTECVRFGNRRIQRCPHERNAAHVQQHSQARKPCRAHLSDQGCRLRHRATQIFPLPGPPEHPGRCPAQSFARRLPLQNRSPASDTFAHPSCPGIQKRTVYAKDRTHAAIISRSYPKYFDHTPNNVSPRMVTMRSPEKISGCSARMVWR